MGPGSDDLDRTPLACGSGNRVHKQPSRFGSTRTIQAVLHGADCETVTPSARCKSSIRYRSFGSGRCVEDVAHRNDGLRAPMKDQCMKDQCMKDQWLTAEVGVLVFIRVFIRRRSSCAADAADGGLAVSEARQRSVRYRRVFALIAEQALATLHRRVFFQRQSCEHAGPKLCRQGTIHGRVIREIERKLSGASEAAGEALQVWQQCAKRLHAAPVAVCEATTSDGSGDRPKQGRLLDASLLVEGRRRRCGTCGRLCGGRQQPPVAVLERTIARLVNAGAGTGAVHARSKTKRCGRAMLQGRLQTCCV